MTTISLENLCLYFLSNITRMTFKREKCGEDNYFYQIFLHSFVMSTGLKCAKIKIKK